MTEPFGEEPTSADVWVALMIGNSRLHWALFVGDRLQRTHHTPHLESQGLKSQGVSSHCDLWQTLWPIFEDIELEDFPELWMASVVPDQSQLWQSYPKLRSIQLTHVPLQKMYSTFGLDRAIALWGAGYCYGWPTLVIDGGTALTLTGADAQATLKGGAILPGLQLQLRSLHDGTAGLPWVELPEGLPERWANDTPTAIQSGVLYTAIAGLTIAITHWCQQNPDSQIVLTGGDAPLMDRYFQQWSAQNPTPWLERRIVDPNLIFSGFVALRQALKR